MHSSVFNYIKSIYFNDNNGSWGQYKSNVMTSSQIPLKFGSEIVINSAFVILSHNSPEPTMNFPSASANKSLFQRQGKFSELRLRFKRKKKVRGKKFRLEMVVDHTMCSKKNKAELLFFELKATCSRDNLQNF